MVSFVLPDLCDCFQYLIYVTVSNVFLMFGQVVLNLLSLENNWPVGIHICLALLEYVHLLLHVYYLLHFFLGFLYYTHY